MVLDTALKQPARWCSSPNPPQKSRIEQHEAPQHSIVLRNAAGGRTLVWWSQRLQWSFVMVQPGPSDYRTAQAEISARQQAVLDQARQFGARAETMTEELVSALKTRPYATIAIAAGLAFAVGALWKLGHRRPRTRLEALRQQLPDVRNRMRDWNGRLQRAWR